MTITRPQVDPDGRYTVTQAAQALSINRVTLWRWIADGTIKTRMRKADRKKIITGRQLIDCWDKMYL